jgi:hypothetical protein
MAQKLSSPITLEELTHALYEMANNKSPQPDDVSTEFYMALWVVLGPEYHQMILEVIQHGVMDNCTKASQRALYSACTKKEAKIP